MMPYAGAESEVPVIVAPEEIKRRRSDGAHRGDKPEGEGALPRDGHPFARVGRNGKALGPDGAALEPSSLALEHSNEQVEKTIGVFRNHEKARRHNAGDGAPQL